MQDSNAFRRDPMSSVAVSAYIDLKRVLKRLAALQGDGTLNEVQRGGKVYLYKKLRAGARFRTVYLGEKSDEQTQLLAQEHQEARDKAEDLRRDARRLTRILRAEGLLPTDQRTGAILLAMARAGLFDAGGVLIGTHAFRLYEGEAQHLISANPAAATDDMDIGAFARLSLALGKQELGSDPSIASVLEGLKFTPAPALVRGRPWRWLGDGPISEIEFLAPGFGEDEEFVELAALGVSARRLPFMNFLLRDPVEVVSLYREGVLVRAPQPARFAIHKMIVAARRLDGDDSLKARKDIEQAAWLIAAMAPGFGGDIADAHDEARASGAAWRDALDRTLARSPALSASLEEALAQR